MKTQVSPKVRCTPRDDRIEIRHSDQSEYKKWLGANINKKGEWRVVLRKEGDLTEEHLRKYYWAHVVEQISEQQGMSKDDIHYDVLLPMHAPKGNGDITNGRGYFSWSEMSFIDRQGYCLSILSWWNSTVEVHGVFLRHWREVDVH